jgi:hypothetical protein
MARGEHMTMASARLTLIKGNKGLSGKAGEAIAESWLRQNKAAFALVDNSFGMRSVELRKAGAKRPDFLLSTHENTIHYLDAKYHQTNGSTSFRLTAAELSEYMALLDLTKGWYPRKQALLTFLLIPKESDGRLLTLVPFDAFGLGIPCSMPTGQGFEVDVAAQLADPSRTFPVISRRLEAVILRKCGFVTDAEAWLKDFNQRRAAAPPAPVGAKAL